VETQHPEAPYRGQEVLQILMNASIVLFLSDKKVDVSLGEVRVKSSMPTGSKFCTSDDKCIIALALHVKLVWWMQQGLLKSRLRFVFCG